MSAKIYNFAAHYERKHSTRDLLLPAFSLSNTLEPVFEQDYSEVSLVEEAIDRIMVRIEELLEERE